MPRNSHFRFKAFKIEQANSALKVCTDACLFGAWVAQQLPSTPVQFLDIGTGTGLLSLMCAQKMKAGSSIIAIEKHNGSMSDATYNFANQSFPVQISVEEVDYFTWEAPQQFDWIICNPPFFNQDLKSRSQEKNLSKHADELFTLNALLQQIRLQLKPNGKWALLLNARRKAEIANEVKTAGLWIERLVDVYQTLQHKEPFRVMVTGSNMGGETMTESELYIKTDSEQYSEAFVALLKEYYLYL